jgi:predicted amidophosphoribosyltransferase
MKEWNKCPGCGVTTSSVSSYCSGCGEPLTIVCSKCGKTWRFWELNKFCPYCGTPVEKHGITGTKAGHMVTNAGKQRVRL